MNEERRAAQRQGGLDQVGNCIHVSEALKLREAWKYALLQQVLHDREHEFEYPLGGFVFDLALLDAHILVEFDGPEHWVSTGCMANDARKEQVAQGAGFTVVRVTVDPSTVIDPTTIHGL